MAGRFLQRDDGFTLSELMVVIGLLGLVVSGAYALLHLVTTGSAQSNQQAWISHEIGQPLLRCEMLFSQQVPPLIEVGPYVCEIQTDQDRDDVFEYHRIESTVDGKLIHRSGEGDFDDRADFDTSAWSQYSANRTSGGGTPLFKYFDVDGSDISAKGAVYIKDYADSVEITMVTVQDGEEYSDSRRVYFRNK